MLDIKNRPYFIMLYYRNTAMPLYEDENGEEVLASFAHRWQAADYAKRYMDLQEADFKVCRI